VQKKDEIKKPKSTKNKSSEKFRETRRYTNKIDFLSFKNGNLIIKRG